METFIFHSQGDPYLLTNDLYDMIFSLKALGVKVLNGDFKVVSELPSLNRISNVGLDDQAYNQSMDYVHNICGLITGTNYRTFCLYINDKKKRKILQTKNSKKLETLRQRAKRWYQTTSKFQEEVLFNYIKK